MNQNIDTYYLPEIITGKEKNIIPMRYTAS